LPQITARTIPVSELQLLCAPEFTSLRAPVGKTLPGHRSQSAASPHRIALVQSGTRIPS
jgi:hypothetical protein